MRYEYKKHLWDTPDQIFMSLCEKFARIFNLLWTKLETHGRQFGICEIRKRYNNVRSTHKLTDARNIAKLNSTDSWYYVKGRYLDPVRFILEMFEFSSCFADEVVLRYTLYPSLPDWSLLQGHQHLPCTVVTLWNMRGILKRWVIKSQLLHAISYYCPSVCSLVCLFRKQSSRYDLYDIISWSSHGSDRHQPNSSYLLITALCARETRF